MTDHAQWLRMRREEIVALRKEAEELEQQARAKRQRIESILRQVAGSHALANVPTEGGHHA